MYVNNVHSQKSCDLTLYFKRANLVHNGTRLASKGSLHYSKVNTSKFGIKYFKYQGIKVLNN